MKIEEILKKIGLTSNEVKTYIYLLKKGEVRAGIIAGETDINRSLMYRVLEELKKKGLISSVIKENRNYYRANDPKNIKRMIQEKEAEIEELIKNLSSIKKDEKDEMKIEVYSDIQGIKSILKRQLDEAKEFFVIGAGNEFSNLAEFFYDKYHNLRIERKINQKILFKKEALERAKKIAEAPFSDVRLLKDEYKVPFGTIIWKDKVALLSWKDKRIILITSSNISEGFKEQFEILWKTSKKV